MFNSIDRLTLASIAGLDVDSIGYRTCKPNIDDTSIPTLHYEFGTCLLRLQLLSKLISFDLASKDHDPLLHVEMHTNLPNSTRSLSNWLHTLFPNEYQEATRVDDQGKRIHNPKWLPGAAKERVRSDYFLVENAKKSHDQSPSKSALYLLSGYDKTYEYTMKSITVSQPAGDISALSTMRSFAYRRRCLYKLVEQGCIPPRYTNQCLLCDECVPDTIAHLICACTHEDLVNLRGTPPLARLFMEARLLIEKHVPHACRSPVTDNDLITQLLLGGAIPDHLAMQTDASLPTTDTDHLRLNKWLEKRKNGDPPPYTACQH